MIRWGDILIDRHRRTIARGDTIIDFSPRVFRLVCALILGRPLAKTALFDHVYDDDEAGGPLSGTKILDVYMCHLKHPLARLGLEIASYGNYQKRYYAKRVTNSPQRKAGDAHDRREPELDGSHGAPVHSRGVPIVTETRPLLPQNRERPTW